MASITKRGKFWRVQIIRKGYPAQYRTFDTKTQAEAWARSIELEMDRGIVVSRSEAERTTLAAALECYWREIASKKNHPGQERRRINQWLRHPLSKYFLSNLRGYDALGNILINDHFMGNLLFSTGQHSHIGRPAVHL